MGFLTFQVVAGLPPCQVNTKIVLSFMEFLHLNAIAPTHMANYMATVRAFHIVRGLQTDCLEMSEFCCF